MSCRVEYVIHCLGLQPGVPVASTPMQATTGFTFSHLQATLVKLLVIWNNASHSKKQDVTVSVGNNKGM